MLIDHYIIATSGIRQDGLKYRRHRLMDKLLQDPTTRAVYWICPTEETDMKKAFLKTKRISEIEVSARIFEIKVNDFKNMTHLIRGVNKSLFKNFIINNGKVDKKMLWYTYPGFSDISDLAVWDKIIYDCSDSWGDPWVKTTGKKRARELLVKNLIRSSEKRIAKNSDILFSTSMFLAEKLKRITGRKVIIIENGVDFDKFSSSFSLIDKLSHIPSPKIGFVGGIKSKLDFELLFNFSRLNPDISLVLIGPVPPENNHSLKTLLALPNVYEVGGIDYEEVPDYMKSIDIGILPYKKIEYNEAVSPLKMFEYLASGIPVVGIGVPTTEKYQQQGVYSYTTNEKDFIEACLKNIQFKNEKNYIQDRLETAKMHDWEKKFTDMINIVKNSFE